MLHRLPLPLRHAYRVHLSYARTPRRYRQLLRVARAEAPARIIEIGVFTGLRAVQMIEAARLGGASKIRYWGFDLFEAMDEKEMAAELSKWPDPADTVRARISATGADVTLVPGYSQDTLPPFAEAEAGEGVDLAFIDGGHAVETIRSDWEAVARLMTPRTTVIFDDYYLDRPDLTPRFGCNRVLEGLDPARYHWERLPDVDSFQKPDGIFRVAMAKVRLA